jgi:hypothetical protein
MAKTFADTTAVLEYHGGTVVGRTAARAALQPRRDVVTSDHVVREWKRIIVTAVSAILDAIDEEPDLSSAFARLGVGHGRAPAQRWRAAAMITGSAETFDPVEVKIRGRQLLRGLEATLRRTVEVIRTTSGCGLALEEPRETAGEWKLKIRCKRGEGICDHQQRITLDLTRWNSASGALALSTADSYRKMGKLGQEMAVTPSLRTGVNCYGRTGDLAIALDCRSDEVLVTTDKGFEIIGPAMGFTVLVIPVC